MNLNQNTLKSLTNTLRGIDLLKFNKSSVARSFLIIFIFLLNTNSSSAQAKVNEFSTNTLKSALGLINIQYELVGFKKYSLGVNYTYHLRFKDEAAGSLVFFARRYINVEAKSLYFELFHATSINRTCLREETTIGYIGPAIGYKHLFDNNITIDCNWGIGLDTTDHNCKDIGDFIYLRIGISVGIRI